MSGRIRVDLEGGGGPGDPTPVEEPVEQQPEPAPPENDNPPPAEPEGEPEPESAEDERAKDQKRIDKLTREKYEAQRQRDEFAAALQQYRQQQANANQPQYQNDNGQQWQRDPREIGRQQGLQEAREEQIAKRFNDDCNTLFAKGQQEFGDMADAVSALNAVGYGNRPDALMALTQLPDGHRVYRELAGNLDNAARILQMPPMQMAVELARMSRGAEASNGGAPAPAHVPPVSQAPPPLRPVGGNATRGERPLDQVSMAEFIRRRDRDERRSRIMR